MSTLANPRLHRRSVLRASAGIASAVFVSGLRAARASALAQGDRRKTLVCVQLEGGADALSMLPPRTDASYAGYAGYAALRTQTAIASPLPLTAEVGLHPALAPLLPYYARGELLALTCIGDERARGTHLAAERAFMQSLERLPVRVRSAAMLGLLEPGVLTASPREPLAAPLARLAIAITQGEAPQAVLLRVPGFDTHLSQASRLSVALAALANDLAAFAAQLGPAFRDTVVLITSERGRSVRENRMAGTEDGCGGAALLLGGNVAGGRVTAPWPDLSSLHARGERALPVELELSSVFEQLGAQLFGAAVHGDSQLELLREDDHAIG